ncbi:hypothetical protein C8Q74DRAFT_399494 [Fomes fomentarius]|nr:hypothetical protein C8Q74DRAFT_399494 [Fomes fomentarius]
MAVSDSETGCCPSDPHNRSQFALARNEQRTITNDARLGVMPTVFWCSGSGVLVLGSVRRSGSQTSEASRNCAAHRERAQGLTQAAALPCYRILKQGIRSIKGPFVRVRPITGGADGFVVFFFCSAPVWYPSAPDNDSELKASREVEDVLDSKCTRGLTIAARVTGPHIRKFATRTDTYLRRVRCSWSHSGDERQITSFTSFAASFLRSFQKSNPRYQKAGHPVLPHSRVVLST